MVNEMGKIRRKTITNIENYIKYVDSLENFVFRGHKSEKYFLIPTIGRDNSKERKPINEGNVSKSIDDVEKELLENIRLTLPSVGFQISEKEMKTEVNTDLDPMIIGQHHGLPTRLLDFTSNPLVALFFAVEGELNQQDDSVVWAINCEKISRISQIEKEILKNHIPNEDYVLLTPKHIDRRISVQSSKFLYFKTPNIPLNENNNFINNYYEENQPALIKILIKNENRKKILQSLDNLGINRLSLFPDLDGFCKYFTWKRDRIFPEMVESSITLFKDTFSEWKDWNQFLKGTIEHSNERSHSGKYSLKKISRGDPNGGYKILPNSIRRGFILSGWICRPDEKPRGTADRIAIENEKHSGYGFHCRVGSKVVNLERRDGGKPIKISNSAKAPLEFNNWYRFELKVLSSLKINITLYHEDKVISNIECEDNKYTNFDRITIHGGSPYYVDDLEIQEIGEE